MTDDNKYIIVDEIAQGGQAIINKVVHREYGYTRALRRLHGIPPIKDKNDPIYQKFVNECKTLLRIGNGSHPNILKTSQPILFRETPAVEMELLIGRDVFDDIAVNGCYSTEKVIQLLKDISNALAYCHFDIYKYCMNPNQDDIYVENRGKTLTPKKGFEQTLIDKYKVIHNDIQSKNIFLNEDGRFILLDFGLSFEGGNVVRSSHKHGVEAYKSPEKFDKDDFIPTEQSDVYSFGVLLYESLTGDVPFPDLAGLTISKEKELQDKRKRINNENIPDIWNNRKLGLQKQGKSTEERDYPQWLGNIILKCLEKEPKNRFQNGKELHDEVLKCLEQQEKDTIANIEKKAKAQERQELESLINAKTREIESLNLKIHAGFGSEREIFNNKIENLNQQILYKEKEISNIKFLAAKTEADLNGEKINNTELVKVNEQLIKKIGKNANLEKDLTDINEEVVILKKQRDGYKVIYTGLKSELEVKNNKIKSLENELEKEKKNVRVVLTDKAQNEIEQLKKSITQKVFVAGVVATLLGGSGGWFLKGNNKVMENSNTDSIKIAVDSAVAAGDVRTGDFNLRFTELDANVILNRFRKDVAEYKIPDEDLDTIQIIVTEHPNLKVKAYKIYKDEAERFKKIGDNYAIEASKPYEKLANKINSLNQ